MIGNIREEELKQVISGTAEKTPEDWDKLIAYYRKKYWREDPDKAEAITRRLLTAGIVWKVILLHYLKKR